jgi:hypothetical protein
MTNRRNNNRSESAIGSGDTSKPKFAERPGIILIGIIIALLGGVPGILSIYHDLFAKPNLVYIEQTKVLAELTWPQSREPDGIAVPFFGLLNDGNKILYPTNFEMTMTHNGQTFVGTKHLLKEILRNPHFQDSCITVDTNLTDFTFVKKIDIGESIYGGMFFSFPLKQGDLLDTTNVITLICEDAYNNKFRVNVPQHKSGNSRGLYFPKLNLTSKQ